MALDGIDVDVLMSGEAWRSKVRRLLAKYDYPPDLEERAVELVLEQATLFGSEVDGGATGGRG